MPNMAPNLSTISSARNPKLLDRVRDVLRRKHYRFRTERTYTDWIKRFIIYHGKRHPKEMAEAEVGEIITHLVQDGKVSPSTQNQAQSAMLFLYKQVQEQKRG